MTTTLNPTSVRRHHRLLLMALALAVSILLTSPAFAVSEGALRNLRVDPTRASIPIAEILSGGPPPQGIPALGFRGLDRVAGASPDPSFVTQEDAAAWLGELEPVILVRAGGEARLYPLQILTWHEIANDTLGGVPIAVSFCPLCNSALAHDRRVPATAAQVEALRVDGHTVRASPMPEDLAEAYAQQIGGPAPEFAVDVTLGVSGMLYFSNMLMFDDTTFTLWSQLIGEGLVGEFKGERLVRYPAQIVGFAEARAAEPGALVLSRDTGFRRDYGRNPYVGYDQIGSPAFLFRGPDDGRLPPKERVITLEAPRALAYRFDDVADARVLHDEVDGEALLLLWAPGTTSAIGGGVIATAADIGAVGVFRPFIDDQRLTFAPDGNGGFVDAETGSVWDVTGRARSGPFEGRTLDAVAHDNTLWFAWAAFRPETEVRRPGGN